MNFFAQIEDYLKTAKANFKAKLVLVSLGILLVITFSISFILSLSEIISKILYFLIPIIIGIIIFYFLRRTEFLKFVIFLKELLSRLEEFIRQKEDEKKSSEDDPENFKFKRILELSNNDEREQLEKLTGISFVSVDEFDVSVRNKCSDGVSTILNRIKGVEKEHSISSYNDIINLVAKNFKLERKNNSDAELERLIVDTQSKEMFKKMDKKDLKIFEDAIKLDVEEKFGKKNLDIVLTSGGFVAANLGGFSTYIMATSFLGGLTSTLGITLPFAFYTTLTTSISILTGPVGLTLLGLWGVRKITKPNINTSILLVLSICLIRDRLIRDYAEKKKDIDTDLRRLKEEKIKIENLISSIKDFPIKSFTKVLLIKNAEKEMLQIEHKNKDDIDK